MGERRQNGGVCDENMDGCRIQVRPFERGGAFIGSISLTLESVLA
ncbi:hypothetical protein P9743_11785 [Anoxybacillus geothermalis]|nr:MULTISPECIES: hypothetical protein [unclassified Geobacillus]MED4878975.1 hypothetical protein [Anoxybacillus geothermalis]MED4924845.1 hypothetical protein [Anoxybacillus geothermalis]